jgi:predicted enzyme related to lactoylglutathione lyase
MVSHGSVYWNELTTSDLEAAKTFYSALFGWTYEEIATPAGPYTLARVPGQARPVAGLIAWPPEESGADQWFVYIAVADIESAVEAVVTGGGFAAPIYDVPGVGRFATVVDPTGATCGMVQRIRDF